MTAPTAQQKAKSQELRLRSQDCTIKHAPRGANVLQQAPSKVNAATAVATEPAPTVTTTLRSAGDPSVVCMHTTLVPDAHPAVPHAPSPACTLAVASTAAKLSPDTVKLCAAENARLGLDDALTTGAASHALSTGAPRKSRHGCRANELAANADVETSSGPFAVERERRKACADNAADADRGRYKRRAARRMAHHGA
jgi:hypothetical protein